MNPRFCRNLQEVINIEASFFLLVTVCLMLLVHWSILFLWYILVLFNAVRYSVIQYTTTHSSGPAYRRPLNSELRGKFWFFI